jgi:hypothetical protein
MSSKAPGLAFYREVLRATRKLPRETQGYYQNLSRESFVAHKDEEPEKTAIIISRSRPDVAWVLNKYAPGTGTFNTTK